MKRILFLFQLLIAFFSYNATAAGISAEFLLNGQSTYSCIPFYRNVSDKEKYAAISSDSTKIFLYHYKSGKPAGVIMDLKESRGDVKPDKITWFEFNFRENKILFKCDKKKKHYMRGSRYYVYDTRTKRIALLSSGYQKYPLFSPDGRSVAFSRNNNLFIKRLDFKTEVHVTQDGCKNKILNGISDYLYKNGFKSLRLFDWSNDSKYLVYLKINEKNVPSYCFMERGDGKYPVPESIKIPLSDDSIPEISIHKFELITRYTKTLKNPVDAGSYIPYMRYIPDGRIAVMSISRNQNMFKMYYINPGTNISRLVFTKQSDTFINPDFNAMKFSDKSFTYLSDDGKLYLYGIAGNLKKQIAKDSYVTDFYGYDAVKKKFYYQTVEEENKRAVYKVDRDGRVHRLSGSSAGYATAAFNSDFSYCFIRESGINAAPVVSVYNNYGKKIRTILSDNKLESTVKLEEKEFFKFSSGNNDLDGIILKPENFDPDKKYPVVVLSGRAFDLQRGESFSHELSNRSLVDSFSVGIEYILAQNGYIVVSVGNSNNKDSYLKKGLTDAEDQLACVKYLRTLGFVDVDRIGLLGFDYGGYVSLLSMTTGEKVFKAGVCVSPIVSWDYADALNAERYMRTRKENGSNYNESSVICRAKNLKGNLLIINYINDLNSRPYQISDLSSAFIDNNVRFDHFVLPFSYIEGNKKRMLYIINLIDSYLKNNL